MAVLPCTKLSSEFLSWNKMQTPHSGHEGLTDSDPQPFSLISLPATLPLTHGALATLASSLFLQVDSADRLGVPSQILQPYSLISARSLLRCHPPHRASGTTHVKKHRSLPFPLLCMPLHCCFSMLHLTTVCQVFFFFGHLLSLTTSL